MSFELKDDRIDFIWKSTTEEMSDHDFQYAILRYASYVMEYRTQKVLIDLTEFKFTPAKASGQFHADYVTKIYNQLGVTQKVHIAPSKESKIVGKEPGTNYVTAFMASYDEGVAWLTQCND